MEDSLGTSSSTVAWGDYELFAPLQDKRLEELSRAEARRAYEHWFGQKVERVTQLRNLLAANGIHLDSSDASVNALNEWFVDHVKPYTPPDPSMPGMLAPEWYSVVVDIATFVGDVMIERYPSLYWEFFTPRDKRYVGYQGHVIAGFTDGSGKVKPNRCYDLDGNIAGLGHRVVSGASDNEDRRWLMKVINGAGMQV